MIIAAVAVEHNLQWPYGAPYLGFLCPGANTKVAVMIFWDEYMEAPGPADRFDSSIRFDEGEVLSFTWLESSDNDSTYLANSAPFIEKALDHEYVFVRIVDYQNRWHDAKFALGDLGKQLQANVDLCDP